MAKKTGRTGTGDTLAAFVGLELRDLTEGDYPGDPLTQWTEAIGRVRTAIEDLKGVLDALNNADATRR